MRALFDSLEASEGHADSLVNESEQKGMEVAEAKFKLRDARQARLQARTMVHSFDEGKFREVVDRGFAVTGWVTGEAQRALDEYVFRRLGLGIATLIITILVITLSATIFIIEHVLKAIMKTSGRVIVINFGEKIAEGTPEEVTRNPGVIEAYLGNAPGI